MGWTGPTSPLPFSLPSLRISDSVAVPAGLEPMLHVVQILKQLEWMLHVVQWPLGLGCAAHDAHYGMCTSHGTHSRWSRCCIHYCPRAARAGAMCRTFQLGRLLNAVQLLWQDCITHHAHSRYSEICITCSTGPRLAGAATGGGMLGEGEGERGLGPDPACRPATCYSSSLCGQMSQRHLL